MLKAITLHSKTLRSTLKYSSVFGFMLALWLPAIGTATTILGMDIDEVANGAEFIFEGEVIQHETQLDSGTGMINTFVTFAVRDVIKGAYSAASVELKFSGGTHNGQVVQISGLKIPSVGEQGIYFVESTTRDLINPLLGWSQGHFLIVEEAGERRVSTLDNKPVTDVSPVANIPPSIKKPLALVDGNSDAAAGVVTDVSPLRIEQAMTVDSFKSRIQGIIGN